MRMTGFILVLLTLSTILPLAGAQNQQNQGNDDLWNDVLAKIPLIQNQFYVKDLAKLGGYLCGLLVVLGVLFWTAGYALAGERPEAAPLLRWGKRMLIGGVLGILLLAILPLVIKWLASGQMGVEVEVPTWGAGTITITRRQW